MEKGIVDSINELVPYLDRTGISYLICDISTLYRDEGVSSSCDHHKLNYMSFATMLLSNTYTKAFICFNDWDPIVKTIIKKANKVNIETIGIIEGVNDYDDVDTGRERGAYKSVKKVFLPGEFEKRYFTQSHHINSLHVCGIQRLDTLLKKRDDQLSSRLRSNKILVNVNFSYGVLADKRDKWISDILEACENVNIDPKLSFHPQDFSKPKYTSKCNISTQGLLDDLSNSKIFITRFSGALFEAILSGCHVIYYNPGIEKIDKFNQPLDAYHYATTPNELVRSIRECLQKEFNLNTCNTFLSMHCNINLENLQTSSSTTVEAIKGVLENSHSHYIDPNIFRQNI